MRVLLADDVPANRRAMKRLLLRRGCEVTFASDGVEATKHACQSTFDVVLLDIQMPNMDGLQACQEIRKLPQCRDLPIIAMSARSTESDRQACEAAGMTACLPKPVDIDELFKAIESIQSHRPIALESYEAESGKITPRDSEVLDREGAMGRLQGDEAIFAMFVKQFSTQAGPLLSEIEHAAERDAMEDAVQPAHQLRGIAANLGAMQVQTLAAEVERVGKADEPSQTSDLVRRLSKAIVDVNRLLEPFA